MAGCDKRALRRAGAREARARPRRPIAPSTAGLSPRTAPFGRLRRPEALTEGRSQMLHLQLHLPDRPDTLACPGCTHPYPLEHRRMRRHVLRAHQASHLAVAERCAFGVLGEPTARDRLRDLLLDGRGQRWRQSGGRRPVGRDAAAFMPLSEAAGRSKWALGALAHCTASLRGRTGAVTE